MAKAKKKLTVTQMLGCTVFPLEIVYNDGKNKYVENSKGYWINDEFDSNGNISHREHSNGSWQKWEHDTKGNPIHYENSNGYWYKSEYDSNGNEIYYEDSEGDIRDNRTKVELTLKEIADKFGIPLSQLRVKE